MQKNPTIVFRYKNKWLKAENYVAKYSSKKNEDVIEILDKVEKNVIQKKLYALGFLSYEAAGAFDNSLKTFDDNFEKIWFGLYEKISVIDVPKPKQNLTLNWQPQINFEQYKNKIDKIKALIVAGDTYQVNFSYSILAKKTISAWELFCQISHGFPHAFYIETDDFAICSASPELFLKIDNDKISSIPMKGTRPRGLWHQHDLKLKKELKSSLKDNAENLMIVDMVRNDLGKFAKIGSVKVKNIFKVKKFPTVWQMISKVSALADFSLSQALAATFPAASITGAPKARTMEIINELEEGPRRIYTGCIGVITPDKKAMFNVAIRTVLSQKNKGTFNYRVGGGIVHDSTCESEWAESKNKARVLKLFQSNYPIFETILFKPKKGFWLLKYHSSRMQKSAEYFCYPFDKNKFLSTLKKSVKKQKSNCKVKILLNHNGEFTASCSKFNKQFLPLKLATKPIDKKDFFHYHKTTNREIYPKLGKEGFDYLLYNNEGFITETTIANIAIYIKGVWYTPKINCGVLPGTLRQYLLDKKLLTARKITISQAKKHKIMVFNSLRGMSKTKLVD